jgi:hypothetical protein
MEILRPACYTVRHCLKKPKEKGERERETERERKEVGEGENRQMDTLTR